MTSYCRGSIKAGVAAGVEEETSDSQSVRMAPARLQQGKRKRSMQNKVVMG